jgi:hypothetical protein
MRMNDPWVMLRRNRFGGHRMTSRKKSKWLAGILAFLFPGVGHMYLGLMLKGIVLMLLIALDISAIVYVSIEASNVLSIVLLSLLMPIIYFFNLFDALQSTDQVNERRTDAKSKQSNDPFVPPSYSFGSAQADEPFRRNSPVLGIILLAAAGVIILAMSDFSWTHWLFNAMGSMIGAVILIGIGVSMWLWEKRVEPRNKP